ncbi:MAG: hypothetical protein K0R24_1214 [Gammaproteobacteria bacterium]|nr:hypothetical protein [Gammaproteobacteria bacterium]
MRQAVEDSIPKIQIAQESQPFYKDDSSAFRYSQIALPLLFLPAQPLDKHSAYELPLSLIHTLGNGTAAEARVSNKIEIEFQQKEKPSAIKLPQNLRTSIDGHLMLGAVLLHLASQSVTWFKHRWWQTPIKKTSPDLLVGAPLLHEKLFNCRQRLLALECQLEEIQFNHLVPDEESRWLIEDTLQPLQAKLLKFKLDATTTQLIDFELDIEALENAIKEIHDAHHEKLLQQSMASARQKVNFFSSQSAVKADVNYAMLAGGLQLQP